MTAAQKTAKLKFKQAIAYRQKTGVTLKEAFAHIYGKKKVGVVKKKAAPKKKVGATDPNKAFKKQMQVNKIINTKFKNWEYPVPPVYTGNWSTITWSNWIKKNGRKIGAIKRKVVKKKSAPKKKAAKKKIGYSKVRLEQEKGITKVLKNTPRTLFPYTAKEKIIKAGKKYFDQEAKKINGIGSVAIEKYKKLNDDINKINIHIIEYTKMSKDMGYNLDNRKAFKVAAIRWKKYQNELKRQAKELKKYI
jgi:hypothetical protein